MVCKKCSAQIQDGSEFCIHCGATQTGEVTQNVVDLNRSLIENTPMKWFKFLIYFALFLGAIINLRTGIQHVTGSIHEGVVNGVKIDAEMIYDFYGSGLKSLDMFCGIACIALAAFGIYVRFALAGFKAKGPGLLYALYAGTFIISLIYMIGASSILSGKGVEMDMSESIGNLFGNVVALLVNAKYFGRRNHLFVN